MPQKIKTRINEIKVIHDLFFLPPATPEMNPIEQFLPLPTSAYPYRAEDQ
jgi:transposase